MNLTDINYKIEINLKQIEFYQSLYQKNQNKTSFLIIVFSFIGLYIIEILKYPFKNQCDISFILFEIAFLILLFISLYKTYCLINPVAVSYLNQPKFFYNDVLTEYKLKLNTDDNELLNEYLRITYLNEIEDVLENNIKVYRKKSDDFTKAFKILLPTLILYLILTSFVMIKKKEELNNISLQNYKEIINYIKDKDGQKK